MTIVFDSAATGQVVNGNQATATHTLGAGAARYVALAVMSLDAFGGGDIAQATYDGVPLSLAVLRSDVPSATLRAALLWLDESGLPPAGAHSVVVDFTGGGYTDALIACLSFEGVAQSAPEVTAGAGSVLSVPSYADGLVTLTDGAWLINAVCAGTPWNVTPDPGQVERFDVLVSALGGSGNTKEAATAGAATLAGTWAASVAGYSNAMMAIAPCCDGGGSDTALFGWGGL